MPPTGLPSWTDIPTGDFDPDSPITSALMTSIVQNIEHNYQWLGSGFTPAEAHNHDGVNSKALDIPSCNFLVTPSADRDWGPDTWWIRSGGIGFIDNSGFKGTASGEYCYQNVLGESGYHTMWGGGASVVLSGFIKAQNALTNGEFQFGLSNNSTTTYMTGCKFVVSYTQLTTAWQRFWGTVSFPGGELSNFLRFLNRIQTTFNDDIVFNNFNLKLGSQLHHFEIDTMGRVAHYGNEPAHGQFWRISEDVPVFDESIAMTNAVKIVGV